MRSLVGVRVERLMCLWLMPLVNGRGRAYGILDGIRDGISIQLSGIGLRVDIIGMVGSFPVCCFGLLFRLVGSYVRVMLFLIGEWGWDVPPTVKH